MAKKFELQIRKMNYVVGENAYDVVMVSGNGKIVMEDEPLYRCLAKARRCAKLFAKRTGLKLRTGITYRGF